MSRPSVSLADALDVLARFAREDAPQYERAALKWIGRYALETPNVSIEDVLKATTWLDALPDRPELIDRLSALVS